MPVSNWNLCGNFLVYICCPFKSASWSRGWKMQTYDMLHCMCWVQRMAKSVQCIKLWNYYRLEVTIVKREEGLTWQELVKGDTKGKEVLDPALVEEMHQRLAHLCSDREVCDVTLPPTTDTEIPFPIRYTKFHMQTHDQFDLMLFSKSNNKHARILVSIRINLWKIFCYKTHWLKYCFL